jgi:putative tryptophan/tyrosine transport system substrate-binding protein
MDRREFIVLAGAICLVRSEAAQAAPRDGVRRIGVLIGLPAEDPQASRRLQTFKRALEELGWSENRNVRIDQRGASQVEAIQAYAAELTALDPDVILSHTTPATTAVRRAGPSIPVVFVSVPNPIGSGFVESLSRPGGNVTGFTNFEPAIGGKWVQVLKEVAPAVTRVAILYNPDTASEGATGGVYLQSAQEAARSLRMELLSSAANDAADIERVFATMAVSPGGAVIVTPNVFTAVHRHAIVALAARHRLPTAYPFRYFVGDGGLVSYGVDLLDLFKRAASYVDAILRGARPSDLPVQSPTKFELAINLRTARDLGLVVPPRLVALADEVIE